MPTPTDGWNRERLLEALAQDPDEYLATHRDDLEALRENVDSDRLQAAIDAVLDDLNTQDESA